MSLGVLLVYFLVVMKDTLRSGLSVEMLESICGVWLAVEEIVIVVSRQVGERIAAM